MGVPPEKKNLIVDEKSYKRYRWSFFFIITLGYTAAYFIRDSIKVMQVLIITDLGKDSYG
jgi:sugar phosphate permease